jgi:hypothetical protein
MTMPRLLTLLIMFALAVTNSAAVASVMCQHEDLRAHVLARESHDAAVSQAALTEETADKGTAKKRSFADAAGASLSGFALPPEAISVPLRLREPQDRNATDAASLANRSLRPMLEPPLA